MKNRLSSDVSAEGHHRKGSFMMEEEVRYVFVGGGGRGGTRVPESSLLTEVP